MRKGLEEAISSLQKECGGQKSASFQALEL